MMQAPYAGRATVEETYGGFDISIPTRKNWIVLVFMSFWLVGWFAGEIMVFVLLFDLFPEQIESDISGPAIPFVLVWFAFWTAGGLFAIRMWLLNGIAREMLEINRNSITHYVRFVPFGKKIEFELSHIKRMRVVQQESHGLFMLRAMPTVKLRAQGAIAFDYGMKTIRIGSALDEAEARYLIELLTSKGIVKPDQVELDQR